MDLRGQTILQIIPSLVTGGAERGCIDMALAIKMAGGCPLVASEGGALVCELERAGIRHIIMPLASKHPLTLWRNAGRLAQLIRAEGVALIHARSRAPAWSGYWSAKRTGTPFITTFHAPYSAQNRFKRAYNQVMTRGQRIIAVSDFVARHIVETYGADPARISTIHRGIDTDYFNPARVSREKMARLIAEWQLPDDRHIVLLPARLTRWKGHAILLQAMSILRRQDVFAVLVGSAQGRIAYQQELEASISQLGLEGQVRIVGGCSDMAAAYSLGTVIVSPATKPEAFGRVIVEAQAMERPVIVSDVGACQETVQPGKTGWIVPKEDPAALASALNAALDLAPDLRSVMGRNGRNFVLDRYTKARMCEQTLAVYDSILRSDTLKPS